ncbi:MAG: hypothetical protein JXJ22_07640 [Bacteroidales bacterium]|nr:hypothetical protein [Bacteroidales bacterium]
MKKLLVIVTLALLFQIVKSQNNIQENSITHFHQNWEAGFALGIVPLMQEDKVSLGLHVHLLRQIEKFEQLRIGIGFENVLDEHTHINVASVLDYNIIGGLSVGLSPGILFLKENGIWGRAFSSHFELLYEFEIGKLHLGPVCEYSYSKLDQHIMLGMHFGLGF